jgi:hypothetical protein
VQALNALPEGGQFAQPIGSDECPAVATFKSTTQSAMDPVDIRFVNEHEP